MENILKVGQKKVVALVYKDIPIIRSLGISMNQKP
jgi:hypothetical protein